MLQRHKELDVRVESRILTIAGQLWSNQEAIKVGMDAAEFNLRAHQKVLNAFALELESLVGHLNDEVFKTEHPLHIVKTVNDVSQVDTDGEPVVVRRLDWPYYHAQVDSELKALAALEETKDDDAATQPEEEGIVDIPSEISVEEGPPQDDIPAGASVFGG